MALAANEGARGEMISGSVVEGFWEDRRRIPRAMMR